MLCGQNSSLPIHTIDFFVTDDIANNKTVRYAFIRVYDFDRGLLLPYLKY